MRYIVNQYTGCWEFISYTEEGYPNLKIQGIDGETDLIAHTHRLAYQLLVGPVSKGDCVCHTCDNKKCINPEHLFLGSYKDNNHDHYLKGRKLGGAKVNVDQVREIRRLHKSGVSIAKLADMFSLSYKATQKITSRVTWGFVTDNPQT